MTLEKWSKVDRYLEDLFVEEDPILKAALIDAAAAGLPAIQVTAIQGRLLSLLARAIGAQRILEIGTLGGYSTIWLARALPEGGRLISLEVNPVHAETARKNLQRAGLTQKAEVQVGPAVESLKKLAEGGAGPFDLVFIDADKPSYPEYLRWALQLCRQGSLIVADNVIRDGEIADTDSQDPNVQAMRKFNVELAAEPRLLASAIQTVGSKGYDGFAIALITG
jgi:predicted O-methyltransferase YrrM